MTSRCALRTLSSSSTTSTTSGRPKLPSSNKLPLQGYPESTVLPLRKSEHRHQTLVEHHHEPNSPGHLTLPNTPRFISRTPTPQLSVQSRIQRQGYRHLPWDFPAQHSSSARHII